MLWTLTVAVMALLCGLGGGAVAQPLEDTPWQRCFAALRQTDSTTPREVFLTRVAAGAYQTLKEEYPRRAGEDDTDYLARLQVAQPGNVFVMAWAMMVRLDTLLEVCP